MTEIRTAAPVEHTAYRLGIVDALLFRRLSATTWAHIGGLGRGRGWAGVVDVSTEDPLFSLVPAHAREVRIWSDTEPDRVLGPYYAMGAAVVRVSDDVLVVFGNPEAPLAPEAEEADLLLLADRLEGSIDHVAPSKRLGDELEVLHAVRAVTSSPAEDLAGTLQHVVDVAVEWLSCEVGLLRDGTGSTVITKSWQGFEIDHADVADALDDLAERAGDTPLCIQDTSAARIPASLGRDRGIRSVLAVPIPAPVGGLLVVAHTDARPRGFTSLCQQLGGQVAEAAGLVAHTAALREQLRTIADQHYRAARRDSLTGLDNRLAWDEALAEAQERVDAGTEMTVVSIDVDGLKIVNDTFGHEAGDALLERCAHVLCEKREDGEVVARLGGDEFAVLLPVPIHHAVERIQAIRTSLRGAPTNGHRGVAASVGFATARPGTSIADAAREADAAMYADKRGRRAAVAGGAL